MAYEQPQEPERMERPRNEEIDATLGVHRPVLDHGFVALVDYMGDDASIVQAARISYGKGTKSAGTDTALIRYLMRHRHTTPFEMVEFKFLMRLPIFVARQIIRHRTASVNEYSARYSILPDIFFVPDGASIRAQSTRNKQGRDAALPTSTVTEFQRLVKTHSEAALAHYHWALNNDVSRELARVLLPLNVYTEWYWKIDLHNFLHFLSLRLDPHAQLETRLYAQALYELVQPICPIAFNAFEDFIKNGINLSNKEQVALHLLNSGTTIEEVCKRVGIQLNDKSGVRLKTGEGVEFLDKINEMKRRAEMLSS